MIDLDLVQWPAMAVTVLAAWLVASEHERRRNIGFWTFMLSNVLRIAWGMYARAWALISLQVCLAAMNIRGAKKTDSESGLSRDMDIPLAGRPAHVGPK